MNFLDSVTLIVTTIFLLITLSYYFLLFYREKKKPKHDKNTSLTVIIPAHNEEEFISESINSVIEADFTGKKNIIVVDDGSIDSTYKIAKSISNKNKNVKVIKGKHSGKSASINKALKLTKADLIAIVDGDSTISKNSLNLMADELSLKGVSAATCVVKVKNRKKILCIWPHFEQLYNSLVRLLLSKVNGNITTPGPLAMYERKALESIGGFSTEGFSEDVDITIRLIRKGYAVHFVSGAVSSTNMPYDVKGFLRQRFRFARGLINILKRHLQFNKRIIDFYTLPIFLFSYVQAIVMGGITVYKIIDGYVTYFYAKGVIFDLSVAKFLFEWFSLVGFIKWTISVFSGESALTILSMVGIISTLLTYPLYLYAIFKFDRKLDLLHIITIMFMFPFWFFLMITYVLSIPEVFRKRQYNIWKKNE